MSGIICVVNIYKIFELNQISKKEKYVVVSGRCLESIYKLVGKYRIFRIQDGDDIIEISYLYTSNDFSGILKECDEGILKWIPKDEVLDLPLWEADPIFLKKLMNNDDFFKLELHYEKNKLIKVVED